MVARGFGSLRAIAGGALVAGGLVLLAENAVAQGSRCALTQRTDPPPPRQVLTCGDRLTIVAEPDATLRLVGGRADAVEVDAKAVLVDRKPGSGPFQVLTPHAIASVRGTIWAVDVSAGQTSVLVVSGRVAVRRPGGGRGVTLGAGEGVDVRPDGAPLTVTRWGAPRAAALLARLGR